MTAPAPNSQVQPTENKPNDKEINFRAQEKAMQDKYERQLAQERQARQEVEAKLQQQSKQNNRNDDYDDEDDDEPYVNNRKLNKKLARHGEQVKQQTQTEINQAVQSALKEERKQNWLKTNSDFYDVMQHAQKFAEADPELAETILQMPEGFERQKLVYKSIKAQGLHKPKEPEPSIQDKINANRRSPSYQPSGTATSPYQSQGDFSQSGQEQAYKKMQELKSRLRL